MFFSLLLFLLIPSTAVTADPNDPSYTMVSHLQNGCSFKPVAVPAPIPITAPRGGIRMACLSKECTKNVYCRWSILAPSGMRFLLNLTTLQTNKGTANVIVKDAANREIVLEAAFTGEKSMKVSDAALLVFPKISKTNNITIEATFTDVITATMTKFALEWSTGRDNELYVCPTSYTRECPSREYVALRAMFAATLGPTEWRASKSWDQDNAWCGYAGVTCVTSPFITPRLTQLNMIDFGLLGTLPATLFTSFPYFEVVRVSSSPGLSGIVPEEIGLLTNMVKLDLSGNHLSGTIPSTLSRCRALVTLFLAFNKLSGGIPGGLPASLQEFDLDGNQLTGAIPATMFTGCLGLTVISLMSNQLTGTLPREVSLLTELKYMNVQGNQLSGTLPEPLPISLITFDCEHNRISGTVPSSYKSLLKLEKINVGYNDLTGRASFLFDLPSLTEIKLNHNNFTEALSESLAKSTTRVFAMKQVSLENNHFSGVIPTIDLTRFVFLENIDLSENPWACPKPLCIPQWSDCGLTLCYNYSVRVFAGPTPLLNARLDDGLCTRRHQVIVEINANPLPVEINGFPGRVSIEALPANMVAETRYVGEYIKVYNTTSKRYDWAPAKSSSSPNKPEGKCCKNFCTVSKLSTTSSYHLFHLTPMVGGITTNLRIELEGPQQIKVSANVPSFAVDVVFTPAAMAPLQLRTTQPYFEVRHAAHKNWVGFDVRCILSPLNGDDDILFRLEYINTTVLRCVPFFPLVATIPKTRLSIFGGTTEVSYQTRPNVAVMYPVVGTERRLTMIYNTTQSLPYFACQENITTPAVHVEFTDAKGNYILFLPNQYVVLISTKNTATNNTFPVGSYLTTTGEVVLPGLFFRIPLAGRYVLDALAWDTLNPLLGKLDPSNFTVIIIPGRPTVARFRAYPKYANLGKPLEPQPSIVLHDVGGNLVTEQYISGGILLMSAVLHSIPPDPEAKVIVSPTRLREGFSFENVKVETRFGISYSLEFFVTDKSWRVPSLFANISTPPCEANKQFGELYSHKCHECKEGMNCSAGTHLTSVLPGYWRPNPFTPGVIACSYAPVCMGSKNPTTNVSCIDGSEGIECGACDYKSHWAKVLRGCRQCASPIVSLVIVILFFIGLLLVCLALVMTNLPAGTTTGEKSTTSVLVKMLLNHLQVTSLLRAITIEDNAFLSDLFFSMDWLMSIDTNLFEIRCAIQFPINQYIMFLAFSFTPLVVLGMSIVVTYLIHKFQFGSRVPFSLLTESDTPAPLLHSAKNVLGMCEHCGLEFSVKYCSECKVSEVRASHMCDKCDLFVHNSSKLRHTRMEIRYLQTAEYIIADLPPIQVTTRTIFVVTSLVLLFFVYPSMMREIATLLRCKPFTETLINPATLTLEHVTRNFLIRDVTVSCDTNIHKNFWAWLSFAVFLLYALAIPMLGFWFLRKNESKLPSSTFLAKFGFLYSGYTKKHYYWEMVVLLRKSSLIFIIAVFSNVSVQVYCAMWAMTGFLFLNFACRPLKYYHKLENTSLATLALTLNLFLLMQPIYVSSPIIATAAVLLALLANIFIVIAFLIFIVREGRREIAFNVKGNPDGDVPLWEIFKRSLTWLRTSLYAGGGGGKSREARGIWTYLRETDPEGHAAIEARLDALWHFTQTTGGGGGRLLSDPLLPPDDVRHCGACSAELGVDEEQYCGGCLRVEEEEEEEEEEEIEPPAPPPLPPPPLTLTEKMKLSEVTMKKVWKL